MSKIETTYSVTSKVVLCLGVAGWHSASVDKKSSEKIKASQVGKKKIGWGSIPVTVTLGKTKWNSSIFPDKKSGTYLLPLRAEIRKKEGINSEDTIRFICELRN